MEQQAKERLTGGAILVVLLVLLVPELLTGPRPVLAPAPAQPNQAPMRSYTMDLGASTRVNSGPVAASTAVVPPTPRASEPTDLSSAPLAVTHAPVPLPNTHTTPVKPAPEVTRPPKATPVHAASLWTVQLGTFSSRENAARLVASLKSHGFGASVSEATRNGHKLFRVRVGSERDRAAARKLQNRLKAAGEKAGEVVER